MTESKKELLMQIKDMDDKLLAFYNTKPQLHPERLSVNELKRLLRAFETVYTLSVRSTNLSGKKAKFKVGDYVMPRTGCNKGIPCRVVETYFPDYEGSEQFITVVPLRKTDILKGHTASRTKKNKYNASWRVFKFISFFKDGKTGEIKPELWDCVDGEYAPILDENGNQMKGDLNG